MTRYELLHACSYHSIYLIHYCATRLISSLRTLLLLSLYVSKLDFVQALVHISQQTLRSANYMFRQICRLLLSAHESLQSEIKKMAHRIKGKKPLAEPEYRDCHSDLERLCKEIEVRTSNNSM